jgi:hypothetical protein
MTICALPDTVEHERQIRRDWRSYATQFREADGSAFWIVSWSFGSVGGVGSGPSSGVEVMEPMESGNHLVLAVEAGDDQLRVVLPVKAGDRLAVGRESDELETVEVLQAVPPGNVAQLTEPVKRAWPKGTPVGFLFLREPEA